MNALFGTTLPAEVATTDGTKYSTVYSVTKFNGGGTVAAGTE